MHHPVQVDAKIVKLPEQVGIPSSCSKEKRSLRFKIFVCSSLFFVVGLTITSSYSYYMARNALLKRTLMQLPSLREVKGKQIEDFFLERANDAAAIAKFTAR